MSRLFYTALSCLLLLGLSLKGQEKNFSAITEALKKGDSKEFCSFFNEMVELNLPGSKGIYSRIQCEKIMRDFFSANPVNNYTLSRQGSSSDGSEYLIGKLEAGGKNYRSYILVRKINGIYFVFQLQISRE